MKHREEDLITNNVPVVCYETNEENELPFIQNGKAYAYQSPNIDYDYAGMAYMGFYYGKPRMSFEDIKKDMINERIKELENIRKKVTSIDFFKENDEFYPEYERLSDVLKKYRHRRQGNPDVVKLNHFIEEHGGEKFEIRRYDIKYQSMMFNSYPEVIKEDNVVCRSSFLEKENDASLERRIGMANALIDNKEDPIGLERDYFRSDFSYIQDNYDTAIRTIEKSLKEHKEVFLIYSRSGNSQKFVKPFVPQVVNTNLSKFIIEDYLYALPNTLYCFRNE